MTEWDLMTELSIASNKADNEKLSSLILDNDFTSKAQAVKIAISCFQITKENVSKHMQAAKKLVLLPTPKSFRESFRQDLLRELVGQIESKNPVT